MGKINGTENKQLGFLKKNGLTREIVHERYWGNDENKVGEIVKVPRKSRKGKYRGEPRYITGMTRVFLFKISDVEALSPEQKKDLVMHLKNEGFGESHCSHLDNFSKKTGRTIATMRAIKDYEEANNG